MTRNSIYIDPRFRGPPESANGGYVCGLLASFVDSPAATVRLNLPPPLSTTLEVRQAAIGVGLYNDNTRIAAARPATVSIQPPAPPSYAQADAAAVDFAGGFAEHAYPSCFVCGPQREASDGLRIFPGPLAGRDMVACTWIPDPSLGTAQDAVAPEFLWAALDCPGAYSFPTSSGGKLLLGELSVQINSPVKVGEPLILVAWQISHDGRKHHTGTALFGETGDCRGLGLGTWFEVA